MPLSSALCGPSGELLRRDDDAPGVVAWLRMVAVVGAREDFLLDVRSDPPSAHVPYLARGCLDGSFGRRGLHEDAGATLADNPLGPSRVGMGVHDVAAGQSMAAGSSAEDFPSRPGRTS